jgi:hypothetical protein
MQDSPCIWGPLTIRKFMPGARDGTDDLEHDALPFARLRVPRAATLKRR